MIIIGRIAHCSICGAEVIGENRIIYSRKSYCKKCYERKQSEKKDYEELIKLICKYFDCDSPPPMILAQIKNYKKTYNLGYAAIGYTLWYIKNIINGTFNIKYGIYQIKSEYQNAEKYFKKQQIITEKVSHYQEKEKKVKLKLKSKITNRLLNIDDLIKGSDLYRR